MMGLPEHRRTAAPQTAEEMHLPDRTVERQRMLVDRHRGIDQIVFARALGELMVRHVAFDRELRIVFPGRMRQVEGYEGEALAVSRDEMEAKLDVPPRLLEVDFPLEDGQRADVERPVARLAVQERCILRGETMGQFGGLYGRVGHVSITSTRT